MTSNDETKGIFKVEEMEIMTTFHQLTNTAFEAWNRSSRIEIPRFNYKEMAMGWEYVKANSSSHIFRLEPTMLSHSELPEKLFLSFTPADTFMGTYKKMSGWLQGESHNVLFHLLTLYSI